MNEPGDATGQYVESYRVFVEASDESGEWQRQAVALLVEGSRKAHLSPEILAPEFLRSSGQRNVRTFLAGMEAWIDGQPLSNDSPSGSPAAEALAVFSWRLAGLRPANALDEGIVEFAGLGQLAKFTMRISQRASTAGRAETARSADEYLTQLRAFKDARLGNINGRMGAHK